MAQLSTMGPPQSPKEIRRSGRRQGPPGSTSNSKSPDSDQPPKPKDGPARPALTTSNSSSARSKRLKQEDLEDADDDPRNNSAPSVTSNGSTHGASNGKGKRRANKDKDKNAVEDEPLEEGNEPIPEDNEPAGVDEEEQGITRCVCGSTEDDPDAGEFMIQCEGCKVWQHGPCMGYMTEDQVDDGDYYCEQCRPEQHADLLKRLSNKKGRHAHGSASRVSRSRSPSQLKQQSKRRNTMNSRDFDESLKEIMEATAAEAAGKDSGSAKDEPVSANEGDNEGDTHSNGKKKRKRIEDELPSKKRTRSASTASDRPGSTHPRDETPVSASTKPASNAVAPAKGNGRNKRGGRKVVPSENAGAGDADEAASATPVSTATKRTGNGARKGGAGAKRPPLSHAVSHTGSGANQEHSTSRARNPAGVNQHTAANAEARAYRNTHAYAVSQQVLHTSFGLPDYFAHLKHILPGEVPEPLHVRVPCANGEGTEIVLERGVKIKWPAKRMSVGDMNKRVRALVEWVGREQIIASDRERRRQALEKELQAAAAAAPTAADDDGDVVMAVDDPTASRPQEASKPAEPQAVPSSSKPTTNPSTTSSTTMRTMEELMEELISFQERFGPGAKTRERERRQGVSSLS